MVESDFFFGLLVGDDRAATYFQAGTAHGQYGENRQGSFGRHGIREQVLRVAVILESVGKR